jgi:hypothetical protein
MVPVRIIVEVPEFTVKFVLETFHGHIPQESLLTVIVDDPNVNNRIPLPEL